MLPAFDSPLEQKWSPKIGQFVKVDSEVKRRDHRNGEEEELFGPVQGKGGA